MFQKNIYLGQQRFIYDREHFLLGGCRLPVYAELKQASDEQPYYGMAVLLNPKIVSELILEYDRVDARASLEKPEGLLVSAKLTDELLESVCRLLRILGDDIVFYRTADGTPAASRGSCGATSAPSPG